MSDTFSIVVVLSCMVTLQSVVNVDCIECYLGDYYPNEHPQGHNPAEVLQTVKCSKFAKSCDVTYTRNRPPLEPDEPVERWHYGCGRGKAERGCNKLKVLGCKYEQYCYCDTDLCLPEGPQFPDGLYRAECDEQFFDDDYYYYWPIVK